MESEPLDLNYSPGLPARLREMLERAARQLGLPLAELELLGQDARTAASFVRAAREGKGTEFVQTADFVALRALLRAREHGEGPAMRLRSSPPSFTLA